MPERRSTFIWIGAAFTAAWLALSPWNALAPLITQAGPDGSFSRYFSTRYPANEKLKIELEVLKKSKKLEPDNEKLIRSHTVAAGRHLGMPPALLWCLLFQESRLDHLVGLVEKAPIAGLGQFSRFSLAEVNENLDRYTADNATLFQTTFGKEIRPISTTNPNVFLPSSYFYIPTAVTASAIYLNNRYHHLTSLLVKRKLSYDPDVLWLQAAMAYNKGTRSVIALWNGVRETQGKKGLEKLLRNRETFLAATANRELIQTTFNTIWAPTEAESFANELSIHMNRISECSGNATVRTATQSEVPLYEEKQ